MSQPRRSRDATAPKGSRPRPTRDVVEFIWQHAPVSQLEIIEQTQLSRGTVSTVLKRLRERELVVPVDKDHSSVGPEGGRPTERLTLRGDAAKALCIDVGRRHVDVALGDPSGIQASLSSPEMSVADDARAALTEAVRLVNTLLSEQVPVVQPEDLVGVCVGVPAPVDHYRDQLASTLGLNTWTGLRPAKELRRRLGPAWDDAYFVLENDATLRALAELSFGAARKHADDPDHTVMSWKWSDGIGGALIHGNHVFTGWRGLAGEVGHTCIPDPDPDIDDCPRCGHKCVEAHAGGRALMRRVENSRNGSSPEYFSDLIARAVGEDGLERQVMRDAAVRVGQAMGCHINAANPRLVIIGGRPFVDSKVDVAAYALIGDAVRDGWRQTGFPACIEDVELVLSKRGRLTSAEGGIVRVLRSGLTNHLERRLQTA
jgi:predicted NBD/HSP70 family sugar kinase